MLLDSLFLFLLGFTSKVLPCTLGLQGMDPINERKVFMQLVDAACRWAPACMHANTALALHVAPATPTSLARVLCLLMPAAGPSTCLNVQARHPPVLPAHPQAAARPAHDPGRDRAANHERSAHQGGGSAVRNAVLAWLYGTAVHGCMLFTAMRRGHAGRTPQCQTAARDVTALRCKPAMPQALLLCTRRVATRFRMEMLPRIHSQCCSPLSRACLVLYRIHSQCCSPLSRACLELKPRFPLPACRWPPASPWRCCWEAAARACWQEPRRCLAVLLPHGGGGGLAVRPAEPAAAARQAAGARSHCQ